MPEAPVFRAAFSDGVFRAGGFFLCAAPQGADLLRKRRLRRCPRLPAECERMVIFMQDLLIVLAQGLVEHPESVSVTVDDPTEDGTVVYHLHVAEGDMGRVIGKQGRIAKAIRTVMRAAANRKSEKVSVEIG